MWSARQNPYSPVIRATGANGVTRTIATIVTTVFRWSRPMRARLFAATALTVSIAPAFADEPAPSLESHSSDHEP